MKSSSANPILVVSWAVMALLLFMLIADPCKNHLANAQYEDAKAPFAVSPTPSVGQKDHDTEPKKSYACSDMKSDVFSVLEVLAAIVMAWFTISLTKLAQSADQTSKKEIRAYLSVSPPEYARIVNEGEHGTIFVTLYVKNNGNTPAKNVRYRRRCIGESVGVLGRPSDALLSAVSTETIPAIPKGEDVMDGEQRGIRFSWKLTESGFGLANSYLFFGLFKYEDVFGDAHRTEFSFNLVVLGRNNSSEAAHVFIYREKTYNDAT